MRRIGEQLNLCASIRDKIAKEIQNDPPLLVNKGGVIADGVNAELDELRKIAYSGKDYLLQIQQRESELTGIPSLKIAYNNVFGKGVCGKPGRVSCTMMIPIFQNFLKL